LKVMSMMSEKLRPSACEVDITGVLAMYALQLASNSPSALLDWNNNYGNDPDKGIIFHCGNFAKSIFDEKVKMHYGDVISSTVGKQNAYGSLTGKIKSGALTYARFTTKPSGQEASSNFFPILRYYVHAPAITTSEELCLSLKADVTVQQALEMAKHTDYSMVGIGVAGEMFDDFFKKLDAFAKNV